MKFIISLVSLFATMTVFSCVLLMLYRSIQEANAKTVDELVAELRPSAEKWSAGVVFGWLLRVFTLCFPAIAVKLIELAASWAIKYGASAFQSVVDASASPSPCNTTTVPASEGTDPKGE